jgi:hypothetical protein
MDFERARQQFNAQHRPTGEITVRVATIPQQTLPGIGERLREQARRTSERIAVISRHTRVPEVLVRERALQIAHDNRELTFEDVIELALRGDPEVLARVRV